MARRLQDDEPRTIAETRAIIERHYMEEEPILSWLRRFSVRRVRKRRSQAMRAKMSCDLRFLDLSLSHVRSKTWDCETVLSTLSNLSNRPGDRFDVLSVHLGGKIGKVKIVKKPPLKPVVEGGEDAPEPEEALSEVAVTERCRMLSNCLTSLA